MRIQTLLLPMVDGGWCGVGGNGGCLPDWRYDTIISHWPRRTINNCTLLPFSLTTLGYTACAFPWIFSTRPPLCVGTYRQITVARFPISRLHLRTLTSRLPLIASYTLSNERPDLSHAAFTNKIATTKASFEGAH